jgi:hypothetical protein
LLVWEGFTLDKVGCSIVTKLKEHHQLCRPEKPAVTEYPINLGHHIQLNDTSILGQRIQTFGLDCQGCNRD